MDIFQKDFLDDQSLQVDHEVRHQFLESAKWAKFIAITVFILFLIGFLILAISGTAIFNVLQSLDQFRRIGSFTSGMSLVLLLSIVFVVFAIFGVVYYFLYNYSVKIKLALATDNTDTMNKALLSLKIFFIISGVFSILTLINNLKNLF